MAAAKKTKGAKASKKAPTKALTKASKSGRKPAAAGSKKSKKSTGKAKSKASKSGQKGKAKASGPRLTAAKQSIRDSLIVARKHQNWPWESIAKEAGISVSATKKAYYSRRAASENLLKADPVKIIEMLVEGLQLSIGDLEQTAVAAVEQNNLAVAVGAKKAANDAREKLQDLLQSVGVLPHELGTLRWHVEFRAVVVQMVDTVGNFVTAIEQMKLPAKEREAIVAEAVQVRDSLEQMGTMPGLNGNGGGEDEQ